MHKPIGSIFTLVGGGTPSTKDERYWGKGIPWFSSADIDRFGAIKNRKTVTELGVENSTTNIVEQGTVVVVTRVGLGKVALLPCDMCFSQDIQALIPKNTGEVFGPFTFYQLQYIMQSLRYKGQGTTISGITKKQLADVNFYLPVHSEQERIVSKIEELFSKLDASVAELQTAKEKLKVYRQAVLKGAFAEFQVKKPIREMTAIVTSGSRGWAKYYSSDGAKFIRIGNLTRDSIRIDFDEMQYVELPENAEGTRTKLHANDVLVSITADLGSIGLVPETIGNAYINQHIALVRFLNPEQSEFMAWYLRSDWGQKDLLKNKRGAGKLGLGLDDIRDTKVPVVTDEQAKTIVSEISARLSVCDSIEQTIDTSLQQAEALRQSILKQAFEGKLA